MKVTEEYPDFFVDHSLFGFMIVEDAKEVCVLDFYEEDEDEE
jgi:hypothetical protein